MSPPTNEVRWYVVHLDRWTGAEYEPVEKAQICAGSLAGIKAAAIDWLAGRGPSVGASKLRLQERDGPFIWEYQ